MKKKVTVIGAGIAGLSSAIRLQAQGYQVDIYEQLDQPGGKMHQLKSQGFTFDVGPTIVMMPAVYKEIFQSVGRNPDDYFKMKRLSPMYDVYFKDQPYRHYSLTTDLVDLMAMNEGLGRETAEGFLRYLSEMYSRYNVAVESFITRPFRRGFRDLMTPHMLQEAMKLKTFDSAEAMMAKFIPNKDLQQMMSFQTLYIGVSPKKGPSLYNIIPMIELLYGVWFIEGGMHSYAQALARLFQELGGRIHYGQQVQEIVVEEEKVQGIRLADRLLPSDYVISNADFPFTIKHLLKDDSLRGAYPESRLDELDYSCSCLIFYWGVKGDFPDLQTHNFVITPDLSENMAQIFDGRVIEDPSLYLHIPSKEDLTMAPADHSAFYVLLPVSELGTASYAYDQERVAAYRQAVLETLAGLPGLTDLTDKIVFEQVFTPNDFEERFSAYRGATFGLQPTLKQSNHWRPQAKSSACQGLYFTGSSTHPGAGVPIVLQSGKICAEELRRDNEEDDFS